MSADADEVWNRACDPYAPSTHAGDAALPEWDETVEQAFREHLRAHPEAYAPLDG